MPAHRDLAGTIALHLTFAERSHASAVEVLRSNLLCLQKLMEGRDIANYTTADINALARSVMADAQHIENAKSCVVLRNAQLGALRDVAEQAKDVA
jgi:hypothetical protein